MSSFATLRRSLAATVGMAILHGFATACPSCYGAADGPVVDGMNSAVMAMMGITGFVLMSILGIGIWMARRMRAPGTTVSNQASVNQEGVLEWDNI